MSTVFEWLRVRCFIHSIIQPDILEPYRFADALSFIISTRATGPGSSQAHPQMRAGPPPIRHLSTGGGLPPSRRKGSAGSVVCSEIRADLTQLNNSSRQLVSREQLQTSLAFMWTRHVFSLHCCHFTHFVLRVRAAVIGIVRHRCGTILAVAALDSTDDHVLLEASRNIVTEDRASRLSEWVCMYVYFPATCPMVNNMGLYVEKKRGSFIRALYENWLEDERV